MEVTDDVVMETESTSEVVTYRELLQRMKTSKLYANGRVVTYFLCKREAVMIYW